MGVLGRPSVMICAGDVVSSVPNQATTTATAHQMFDKKPVHNLVSMYSQPQPSEPFSMKS